MTPKWLPVVYKHYTWSLLSFSRRAHLRTCSRLFMLPFSLPFYLLSSPLIAGGSADHPIAEARAPSDTKKLQKDVAAPMQDVWSGGDYIIYCCPLHAMPRINCICVGTPPHCSDGVVCPPPKVAETTDACNGDIPCVTGEKILCCDQPPTTNHTATACLPPMTAYGKAFQLNEPMGSI